MVGLCAEHSNVRPSSSGRALGEIKNGIKFTDKNDLNLSLPEFDDAPELLSPMGRRGELCPVGLPGHGAALRPAEERTRLGGTFKKNGIRQLIKEKNIDFW